jgi:hypothetical protein
VSNVAWAEEYWNGTLTSGLAHRAGVGDTDLAKFENVRGRAEVEGAVDELVEALGGETQYSEATEESSEAHLTVSRVHLRLRESALDLAEQTAALIVSLIAMNPAAIVPAIKLVRIIVKIASVLSPSEQEALARIVHGRRMGTATHRADLADLGVDIDGLISRGVLREIDEELSIRD